MAKRFVLSGYPYLSLQTSRVSVGDAPLKKQSVVCDHNCMGFLVNIFTPDQLSLPLAWPLLLEVSSMELRS